MSRALGTRAGAKSVRFWQLSSCWSSLRWWLLRRGRPLCAQLGQKKGHDAARGAGARQSNARYRPLIPQPSILD